MKRDQRIARLIEERLDWSPELRAATENPALASVVRLGLRQWADELDKDMNGEAIVHQVIVTNLVTDKFIDAIKAIRALSSNVSLKEAKDICEHLRVSNGDTVPLIVYTSSEQHMAHSVLKTLHGHGFTARVIEKAE